jgi:hypothetical protein
MHGNLGVTGGVTGPFWADAVRRSGGRAVLAAVVLLSASGCGSGGGTASSTTSSATATAKSHKQPHKTPVATKPGELPLGEMVAAVSPSKGPPVELKFSLPTRPEVGQVTDIEVAVVPRAPVPDNVSVDFQVVEGLEIVGGAQMDRVDKLTDGSPVRHIVKVLPKRDGVFTLTAVVSFTAANHDTDRTFSIPVIAGEGMPDQVAKGP